MVTIWYKSMEGETPASSESRLFAIERSERVKGVLRAKTGGWGFHPESSSMGARGRNQARADSSRLRVAKLAKGELRA